MDTQILAILISTGSKLVSEMIRNRPITVKQQVATQKVTIEPETKPKGTAPCNTCQLDGKLIDGEIVKKGVSTAETIQYQKEQLVKQITLMELHLAQGCKIHGTACDCCEKHPEVIEALAEETYGMTGDPVYKEIIDWCEELKPRTTAAASASGQFDSEYAAMAQSGRRIRKILMGSAVALPEKMAPVPSAAIALPPHPDDAPEKPSARLLPAEGEGSKQAESVADTVITRLENLSAEDKAEIRRRLVARLKESEEAQ